MVTCHSWWLVLRDPFRLTWKYFTHLHAVHKHRALQNCSLHIEYCVSGFLCFYTCLDVARWTVQRRICSEFDLGRMWPHAGWWSWFNDRFHLARSNTYIFFFLGLQHCEYSISMPNMFDSYLLHVNPVVNKMRAKGSAKRECGNPSCVGVLFSPDAPLISRLRIVPPKERTYALARLARQVGQRETCSKAWKTGLFSDQSTGPCADLQEASNRLGALWMADGKFLRDFLENPTHETCSKLHGAVWDLWPFLQGKNAADLRGEWGPGIQSRWRAEAFSLTWSRGYSCKPCFSGSQLWRLLSQFFKKQDSLGSFWLMGFIITRTTCTETIRKNSALDQPKRLFLGPGQSCFFHLCWVLKLQSQNFLKKLTVLLTWTQTNHRTPLVPPIVNREPFNTHSGKTWFPPIFTFKYLKFGTVQVPPAAPAIQRWRGKLFPAVGKRHCRGHGPSGILAPRCSKVDLLVDLSGVCLKIDEHRVSQIPWFINICPTLKWPFVGIFRFQTLLSCVRCLGKTQRFQGTPLHSAQD